MTKQKTRPSNPSTDSWIQRLITCFINQDIDALEILAKETPQKRSEIIAIREYYRWNTLQVTAEATYQAIAPLLENAPPLESDELACMILVTGANVAAVTGREKQGWEWLKQFDLRSGKLNPDLRAACLYAKAYMCASLRERGVAVSVLTEAMACCTDPPSLLWYRLLLRRAMASILQGNLSAARSDIALLREHSQFDPLTLESVDALELHLCIVCNHFSRGFELLGQLSKKSHPTRSKSIEGLEVWLLIVSGELSRARTKLDQMRDKPWMNEESYLYFRGLIYLAHNQPGRAIQYAMKSMSIIEPAYPRELMLTKMLLLDATLVQRDATQARHRLENLEIYLERFQYLGYAIRLSLLEGHKTQAVRELREFLSLQDMTMLMERWQHAHELSVTDLAIVWGWAQDAAKDHFPPPHPISAKSSRKGNRQTILTRRHRLHKLFHLYGQLARGDVARMMGCGLQTAAKDLSALEADGLIRRVETSAHPRTGYYEQVPQ